jgi:hypothetical protein
MTERAWRANSFIIVGTTGRQRGTTMMLINTKELGSHHGGHHCGAEAPALIRQPRNSSICPKRTRSGTTLFLSSVF